MLYEKNKNIITEKVGIKETYRKIIKRNNFTILIFILIRYKKTTGVIIIKTITKTIIIIIVKLFIIMTLSYHTVWWKNKLIHTNTHTHENMDIVLLTLLFASIEAPATSRHLVTSKWPPLAACMSGVIPLWWKYVNEGKYNIRYDYR